MPALKSPLRSCSGASGGTSAWAGPAVSAGERQRGGRERGEPTSGSGHGGSFRAGVVWWGRDAGTWERSHIGRCFQRVPPLSIDPARCLRLDSRRPLAARRWIRRATRLVLIS